MTSDERRIDTYISLGNVKDQVAALLYATGVVKDNEDVLDIQFTNGLDKSGLQTDGLIPISIKIRSPERMELTEL